MAGQLQVQGSRARLREGAAVDEAPGHLHRRADPAAGRAEHAADAGAERGEGDRLMTQGLRARRDDVHRPHHSEAAATAGDRQRQLGPVLLSLEHHATLQPPPVRRGMVEICVGALETQGRAEPPAGGDGHLSAERHPHRRLLEMLALGRVAAGEFAAVEVHPAAGALPVDRRLAHRGRAGEQPVGERQARFLRGPGLLGIGLRAQLVVQPGEVGHGGRIDQRGDHRREAGDGRPLLNLVEGVADHGLVVVHPGGEEVDHIAELDGAWIGLAQAEGGHRRGGRDQAKAVLARPAGGADDGDRVIAGQGQPRVQHLDPDDAADRRRARGRQPVRLACLAGPGEIEVDRHHAGRGLDVAA